MNHLAQLTPEQRAALTQMPPQMAQKIIGQLMGGQQSSPPMGGQAQTLAPQMPSAQPPPQFQQPGLPPLEQFDPNLMPGIGPDPRGMFGQEDAFNVPPPAQNSFQPGAEFQTAQSGPLLDQMRDLAQPPALGVDAVAKRRIQASEISQRNAMSSLQLVLDEITDNPGLLDDVHTISGRTQTSFLRFRDRLGIDAWDIGPEQEQRIGNAASYRQKLLTNVNSYIKEITGATIGQGGETTRLMAVQPNEDDSPSEIVSKLRGAIDIARMNTARFNIMQRNPGTPAPSDKELRQFLSDAGKRLYEEALQSGLDPTQARMQAARMLSEEFGL